MKDCLYIYLKELNLSTKVKHRQLTKILVGSIIAIMGSLSRPFHSVSFGDEEIFCVSFSPFEWLVKTYSEHFLNSCLTYYVSSRVMLCFRGCSLITSR